MIASLLLAATMTTAACPPLLNQDVTTLLGDKESLCQYDFGQQEPGSAQEIADFCDRTYAVKFPMFSKTAVKQAGGSPFYDRLAEATGQRPKWNFHKYLISRDGRTVASFGSAVEPDSPDLVSRIEESLAAR